MPIDINSSLSEVSNYAFGSSWLNKILSSTLIFALVITLVIIMIVILLYPAKKNAGFGHLFKLGLWIYISTSVLVFLHDGIKNKKIENDIKTTAGDRIMNPNSSVAYGDMRISVQPEQPIMIQQQPAQQLPTQPVQLPQQAPVQPAAIMGGNVMQQQMSGNVMQQQMARPIPIIKGGQPFSAFK